MSRPALAISALLLLLAVALAAGQLMQKQGPPPPTFYRDVMPILQNHCQRCHRPGEIGPMPLVTYKQVRFQARKIALKVRTKQMPPWLADPCCGHFSNDPSLTQQQIDTLVAWANAGVPEGDRRDAPPPPNFTEGWNIPKP